MTDKFDDSFDFDSDIDDDFNMPVGKHVAGMKSVTPHVSSYDFPNSSTFIKENLEEKKTNKTLRICLIVFAVVLAIIIAIFGGMAWWVHNLNNAMKITDPVAASELNEVLEKPDAIMQSEPFYMVLLGSDARSGDSQSRSDVTILVRADATTGVIDLISIPRDTMIDLDIYGTQKINAAYAYGGPAGSVSAVSEFAGVPVSHYAEINFDSLVELVDALGGVTVTVPESFNAGNSGGISLEAGEQVLTGEQALGFARERYNVSGGDFSRAQAQRLIVTSIIKEVLATPVTELPGTIEKLLGMVSTDLTVKDLITLATQFQKVNLTIYNSATPSYTYFTDGVSYVATMYDEWHDMMCRVDAGLDPDDESVEIPQAQLDNERLGSATNGASPRDYYDLAANAGMTTDSIIEID